MPKTVRFSRVVERSGQPQAHALWLPPEKDPEFKRALAAHRVMTVQPRRGKTDLGFVGFDAKRSQGGQFLIFPKSLKPFDDAEIVGIKFDLIEQPKIVAPTGDQHVVSAPARKASSAAARARAAREFPETEDEEAEEKDLDTAPPPTPSRKAAARATPPPRTRRSTPAHAPKSRRSHTTSASIAAPSPDAKTLLREIRAALKELERGKSVAAYQRLERAIKA